MTRMLSTASQPMVPKHDYTETSPAWVVPRVSILGQQRDGLGHECVAGSESLPRATLCTAVDRVCWD